MESWTETYDKIEVEFVEEEVELSPNFKEKVNIVIGVKIHNE